MTKLVRDSAGFVLPVEEQPWFDGARTPKECISAWETAYREDWARFDKWQKADRSAQAAYDAKWSWVFPAAIIVTSGLIAWVLTSIMDIARR